MKYDDDGDDDDGNQNVKMGGACRQEEIGESIVNLESLIFGKI